jgi:hypothetical protein
MSCSAETLLSFSTHYIDLNSITSLFSVTQLSCSNCSLSRFWRSCPLLVPHRHNQRVSQVRQHKRRAQEHREIFQTSILDSSKHRDLEACELVLTPKKVELWLVCRVCFHELGFGEDPVTSFVAPRPATTTVRIFSYCVERHISVPVVRADGILQSGFWFRHHVVSWSYQWVAR